MYTRTFVMEDLCCSCLCTGRKLKTLEASDLNELFSQILSERTLADDKATSAQLCWECSAKLRNWHKFRSQAKSSYKLLLEYDRQKSSTLLSFSTLSTYKLWNIDYSEKNIKSENILAEDEIKSEVDEEHCEPETFVNEIDVMPKRKKEKEENLTTHEPCSPSSNKNDPNTVKTEDLLIIDDIKSDVDDEHCEPETFVNEITVVPKRKKEKSTKKPRKRLKVQKFKTTHNVLKDEIKEKDISIDNLDSYIGLNETDVQNHRIMNNEKDGIDEKISSKAKMVVEKSKTTRKKKLKDKSNKNLIDNTHDFDDGLDVNEKIDVKEDEEIHQDAKECGKDKANDKVSMKETDKLVYAKKMIGDRPQCVECGKIFSSKKTFRYHWNVLHKGQNRYPCPTCGKVYQWKSNLGRHIRSHKARDSGELYCELCDKRFASVATYKQHLRVSRRHVSESDFCFMCNECGKKFVSKTRLRDHIDWEHLKKIKFRCQLCDKPFKCHTSLYVHMQNVHKNKEKDLCHVCGKAYQNAAKLKYHIVAMHTDKTPYECVHCRVSFGWYSSLYRHVREVHHKMKLQPKRSSKKSKKLEILPGLMNHPPPMHLSGPSIT